MKRRIFYGSVFGLAAMVACDESPQAPTTVQPPASSPAAAAPGPGVDPSGSAIVGSYTLTLDVGSGCAVVPQADRTRRYTARIESGAGGHVVTLGDATFLWGPICTYGSGRFAGIGCHQFFATVDGDSVQFDLANNNDEAHGGHIVEQVSPDTWSSAPWLEIIGTAAGRLEGSSIKASGNSKVWYCQTPLSYPFPCPGYVACDSTDMKLTFTRR
jgi:hypothetical protein